jgi:uncharacterized membrane protein YoaK (UPF0700 family)
MPSLSKYLFAQSNVASSAASGKDQPELMRILLLVTLATGVIDGICLLHLGVFTAYMTGTLILIGLHLGGASPLAIPALIALACFGLGAICGGRLVHRLPTGNRPPAHMLAHILTIVAVLILCAAILTAFLDIHEQSTRFLAIVLLGLAMGLQIAGSRQAGVLDMTIPAATMILHGLFFDSRLGGGKAERQGRRLAVVTLLIVGAALGAAIAAWQVWAGLLCGAALLTIAATASYALARHSAIGTS